MAIEDEELEKYLLSLSKYDLAMMIPKIQSNLVYESTSMQDVVNLMK